MQTEIVYISSIPWEFMWQRPQQLVTSFVAEGSCKVLYVEPPLSLISLIKSPSQINKISIRQEAEGKITILAPFIVFPLRFRWLRKFSAWLMARSIKRVLTKKGFDDPVIMICHTKAADVISHFRDYKVCFDCVDEVAAFPGIQKDILKQEQLLINNADLILVTALKLLESRSRSHDNVCLVPNGADVNHFAKAVNIGSKPSDLKQLQKPIIGYFGALAEWLDFDIIKVVAERRPQWNFVLIGPQMMRLPKLPENVRVLGQKNYRELPGYVGCFDVCIIPFKINELTLNTNPVKLYEYLAAGKPVVSTPLPEVRGFAELVKIAGSPLEFEAAINACLVNNSPKLVQERQRVAEENSWDKRAAKILELFGGFKKEQR